MSLRIQFICEPVSLQVNLRPYRFSLIRKVEVLPVPLAIAQKCSILILVHLFRNEEQQFLVVLEVGWKLHHYLPYALKVLNEDRRPLFFLVMAIHLAHPQVELMAERQPVFVYDYDQPVYRSIVRIN